MIEAAKFTQRQGLRLLTGVSNEDCLRVILWGCYLFYPCCRIH